jgi:membrane-associated phospholipid phosphatase
MQWHDFFSSSYMPFKIDTLVRNKIFANNFFFDTHLDLYVKWAPFVSLFVLDAARVKMKHSFMKHILLAGVCEAIQAAITQSFKRNYTELRPQPSLSMQSFPSGHAATSFAGAELLRHELNDASVVLRYSGYGVAVAACVLRLCKNKHWLSDVAAGAVIGIISARIAIKITAKKKANVSSKRHFSSTKNSFNKN